jgi:parallel beta-helix repeat protein
MHLFLSAFRTVLLATLAAAHGGALASGAGESLPLPEVQSGSTLSLQCGRVYSGTLNLVGKQNVTVKTEGTCGKAAISPGKAISGWKRTEHGPNPIYSAPVDFEPVQLALGGKALELAHFPNRPQVWAKGKSDNPFQIRHAMPDRDLVGALLVYRANEWLIEKRRVADYVEGHMTLAPKTGDNFDPPAKVDFYVEGKLWMLDAPGEWAFRDGRLYVWPPDGRSPEGRAWASPKAAGIDASNSRDITIDGVKVFLATNGIDGSDSFNLHILNTEVRNSLEDGIFAGGTGLVIDKTTVTDSGQNGIYGYYGITRSAITNSSISGSGMLGMPKRSKGGIVFEEASGQRIANNTITNSSYIGIRVHRNAIVSDNLIDGACLILTDCGGIYTFARDKLPLNVRIEGNTIKNLAQRQAYAIYLDDHANGVIVTRNTISNNPGGMEIHNGFNNIITQNVFSASTYEHILFNETGEIPSIRHNQISHNLFISTKGEPVYRLWSVFEGKMVERFGYYNDNTYSSRHADFAEVAGTGMLDYSKWKSRMKQDARSILKAPKRAEQHKPTKTTLERLWDRMPWADRETIALQ